MPSERTAVQTIGGGVGTYILINPYGEALCELVIHSWVGAGATTQALLDLDSALGPAPSAAIPTFTKPFRGMPFTSIGQSNGYAPLITEAERNVTLYNLAGSSWIVYQWQRIVPDAGADAIRHSLAATQELIAAAHQACGKSNCGCATHRAIARALGDARLSDRT